MKVKTFFVYLPELNISFNPKKLDDFQRELDDFVGYENTSINLNHTPYNTVTNFTIAVWVLGRTEEENRNLMNKVEEYLKEHNIVFSEYESYLLWDEKSILIEVEVKSRIKH